MLLISRLLVMTLFISAFFGCASSPKRDVEWVRYYEHSSYGLVSPSDKRFLQAVSDCSRKAFGDGVEIDGQLETNGLEIINRYKKHKMSFALNKSIGLSDLPTEKEALQIAEEYAETVPEYVRIIHRKKPIYDECFYSDNGFTRKPIEIPFDKNTGQKLEYNSSSHSFSVVEDAKPSEI